MLLEMNNMSQYHYLLLEFVKSFFLHQVEHIRWQNTGFLWHSNDAKGKVVSFIKKTYNNMPFLILLSKSKNEVSRSSEFFYRIVETVSNSPPSFFTLMSP